MTSEDGSVVEEDQPSCFKVESFTKVLVLAPGGLQYIYWALILPEQPTRASFGHGPRFCPHSVAEFQKYSCPFVELSSNDLRCLWFP